MQMQNIQKIKLNSVWCIIHSSSFKCTPRSSFPSLLDLLWPHPSIQRPGYWGHLLSWSKTLYMHTGGGWSTEPLHRGRGAWEMTSKWPGRRRETLATWGRIPDRQARAHQPKSKHLPVPRKSKEINITRPAGPSEAGRDDIREEAGSTKTLDF